MSLLPTGQIKFFGENSFNESEGRFSPIIQPSDDRCLSSIALTHVYTTRINRAHQSTKFYTLDKDLQHHVVKFPRTDESQKQKKPLKTFPLASSVYGILAFCFCA